MDELNLRPTAASGLGKERSVVVPALAAGAYAGQEPRSAASMRATRRRIHAHRFALGDAGFRPFRVY